LTWQELRVGVAELQRPFRAVHEPDDGVVLQGEMAAVAVGGVDAERERRVRGGGDHAAVAARARQRDDEQLVVQERLCGDCLQGVDVDVVGLACCGVGVHRRGSFEVWGRGGVDRQCDLHHEL